MLCVLNKLNNKTSLNAKNAVNEINAGKRAQRGRPVKSLNHCEI
jgi:hypothetical protein